MMCNRFLHPSSSQISQNSLQRVIFGILALNMVTSLMLLFQNRRSKSGCRFGFVWLIKIKDVDRLVNNLCTIWVGRLRIHANIARFQRSPMTKVSIQSKSNVVKATSPGGVQMKTGMHQLSNSYVHVAKTGHQSQSVENDSKPAMVLDDSCTFKGDLSLSVFGKLKEFSSLANIKTLLATEGFDDIVIQYMGGFWVLLKFISKPKKDKFMGHVGVGSWFAKLQHASTDFEIDERVTWIDIEGKIFWIHAKEVTGWTPDFNIEEDDFSDSDVESLQAKNDDIFNKDDSEIEEVPETIFEHGEQGESKSPVVKDQLNDGLEEAQSKDPFSLYKLLNKKHPNSDDATQFVEEPKYPPGFTPLEKSVEHSNMENIQNSQDQIEEPTVLKTVPITKPNENGDVPVCSGHFQNAGNKNGAGGILCVWDPNMFRKEHSTVSDYFIAFMGKWVPNGKNFLIILVYAPQELSEKKMLWQYLNHMIDRWKGEVIVMGDFNEVRSPDERFGSIFNSHGAAAFNNFISLGGLMEVPTGGYSYTWSHKSASKMSKLDRFLIFEDFFNSCPNIFAIILDRYLSDHRPILLRESNFDYGPTPFRFYHYWFEIDGFDSFVADTWRDSLSSNLNPMLRLVTKLKHLKEEIRKWTKEKNVKSVNIKKAGRFGIKWSIEGDENSKYFHGIINKQRNNIAIRGILVDGAWIEDPRIVKNEVFTHFKDRFNITSSKRLTLDMEFPNKLSIDQKTDLERPFTKEEIKGAVWDCGLNKSPGPDGFKFCFYQRYWCLLEHDIVDVVNHFFTYFFPRKGCNSSFIALIPKSHDPKQVKDFRPISLIGSLYKIIAKLLANRLVLVMANLVNEVQSAFIDNRQILDGPFILNEIIQWCKAKKKQTMIFKVDFEKAFDSVRWDFLDDVLKKFGFGSRWCDWIQSCLRSSRGSILVNGSPTSEFQFH
ncbi:RNA-directed DNA polymerase, eukaryota, partial [Tanacetum coccineum]